MHAWRKPQTIRQRLASCERSALKKALVGSLSLSNSRQRGGRAFTSVVIQLLLTTLVKRGYNVRHESKNVFLEHLKVLGSGVALGVHLGCLRSCSRSGGRRGRWIVSRMVGRRTFDGRPLFCDRVVGRLRDIRIHHLLLLLFLLLLRCFGPFERLDLFTEGLGALEHFLNRRRLELVAARPLLVDGIVGVIGVVGGGAVSWERRRRVGFDGFDDGSGRGSDNLGRCVLGDLSRRRSGFGGGSGGLCGRVRLGLQGGFDVCSGLGIGGGFVGDVLLLVVVVRRLLLGDGSGLAVDIGGGFRGSCAVMRM